MGFKSVGNNVLISKKASIYDCAQISIGNNVRIDDFCLISGHISISSYVHLAPYVMLAGGKSGIIVGEYVTFAYGVKVFAESDDYSGESAVGSLVTDEFKNVKRSAVYIDGYTILGTNSIVMPGCRLGEGVSLGASTLVNKSLDPWQIYVGQPARKLKARSMNIVQNFQSFIEHSS
tara:strand:- start:2838 stop:3365 length:528 start_codon:yes stop_codon:yes gene_type:complete